MTVKFLLAFSLCHHFVWLIEVVEQVGFYCMKLEYLLSLFMSKFKCWQRYFFENKLSLAYLTIKSAYSKVRIRGDTTHKTIGLFQDKTEVFLEIVCWANTTGFQPHFLLNLQLIGTNHYVNVIAFVLR